MMTSLLSESISPTRVPTLVTFMKVASVIFKFLIRVGCKASMFEIFAKSPRFGSRGVSLSLAFLRYKPEIVCPCPSKVPSKFLIGIHVRMFSVWPGSFNWMSAVSMPQNGVMLYMAALTMPAKP